MECPEGATEGDLWPRSVRRHVMVWVRRADSTKETGEIVTQERKNEHVE